MSQKKLIIDLEKCEHCEKCTAQCSYKHHPQNDGLSAVLEKVRFALICRKCELAPCIAACPRDALEKVPTGRGDEQVLKRANMLCTGCQTCTIACPFGTVYPELVVYFTSSCDVCTDRLAPDEKPLCVRTCPCDALEYKETEIGDDMVEVFPGVVAKVTGGTRWEPILRQPGPQAAQQKK